MANEHGDIEAVHSTISPRNPGSAILDADDITNKTVIDPPASSPARTSLRYRLTRSIVGRIEAITRARFEIYEAVGSTLFDASDEQDSNQVARTVVASIGEGKGVSAREVPAVRAAVTGRAGGVSVELGRRERALADIAATSAWALQYKGNPAIAFDFILELHRRMFGNTYDHAGRLKQESVVISGSRVYHIETLAPKRCEEFLRKLCGRTNEALIGAVQRAENSIILVVAEFLCDFLAIHPFEDGNGRIARLLSTYLLGRYDYRFGRFSSMDDIVLETRDQYYASLYKAQSNWYKETEDLTPWIWYYVNSVYEQCRRAWDRVHATGAAQRDGLA